MDDEKILQLVSGLVDNGQMYANDFNTIFDSLTYGEDELEHIIDVLAANNICVVDDEDDDEETEDPAVIKARDDFYRDMFGGFSAEKSLEDLMELSNEELCFRFQNGDEEAGNALCIKNKSLIFQQARYFMVKYSSSLELSDLGQSGYEGLVTAAKKYNHSKNSKFITFAFMYVRNSIRREIMKNGYPIRIPENIMWSLFAVRKARLEILSENETINLADMIDQIAEKTGKSADTVRNLLVMDETICYLPSIDTPVESDGDKLMAEYIEDCMVESPDEATADRELKECIDDLLNKTLKPNERRIIFKRYGLHDSPEMTMQEIGDETHVTRAAINQVEKRAIKKLQKSSEKDKFKKKVDGEI